MKILVLNCGSSSLKYQIIDMEDESVVAIGICERIGIDGSFIKHENSKGEKTKIEKPMADHTVAIEIVIETLLDDKIGVLKSIDEIGAVGHRVVHGGEAFTKSVIINEKVKQAIAECAQLAPLHNPANLLGINVCEKLLPNVKQVAVFDTAFHQTMEEKAFLYGIPYKMYTEHKIRRYGFHGTSHMYVSGRVAENMNKPIEELKIITCHLGNGASVCAVKHGKCVDTSMGLTPLEGLIMGTRSGDIDPAVIPYIMKKENMTCEQVENMLNKQSGVLGVSEMSSDFRDLENGQEEGKKEAIRALDLYHYRIAKYVGSYAAAMNGVDAIVFTAGVGENGSDTRSCVCEYLGYLGVDGLDPDKNSKRGKELEISTPTSKTKVFVIPTNEELVIARDTKALLS